MVPPPTCGWGPLPVPSARSRAARSTTCAKSRPPQAWQQSEAAVPHRVPPAPPSACDLCYPPRNTGPSSPNPGSATGRQSLRGPPALPQPRPASRRRCLSGARRTARADRSRAHRRCLHRLPSVVFLVVRPRHWSGRGGRVGALVRSGGLLPSWSRGQCGSASWSAIPCATRLPSDTPQYALPAGDGQRLRASDVVGGLGLTGSGGRPWRPIPSRDVLIPILRSISPSRSVLYIHSNRPRDIQGERRPGTDRYKATIHRDRQHDAGAYWQPPTGKRRDQ